MAAIPKLKGFVVEDFKEAPEWFHKFLTPINEYMTAVTNALSGRLTTKDNLLAYDEPFDFTTATAAADTFPMKFKNKLLGGTRPTSVQVGQIYKKNNVAMSAAYSISWVPGVGGDIEITFQGLENSTQYLGILTFSA